ncbi:MAG: PQQ-binding-like beta-propeller repeat protein [Planctomycetaceae bacterium]
MQRQRFSVLSLALLAAVIGLLAGNETRAQSRSVQIKLPSPRDLARSGLERSWWGQATINPSRDTVRHLVADEETVFIQSTAGVMTAFDAENGRKIWAVQLGRNDQISYPAVTNKELVLIAVGMRVHALDRDTGERMWDLELDRHPSTSPSLDENYVYIGAIDGSVYAYDLRKIHQLFNENLLPQWTNVALAWRFRATREITSAPISNGRVVSFASRDRSLYSVTCDKREVVFQFESQYPASAPLAEKGDSIFLVSGDQNVYCVNINNGKMNWRFVTGSLVDEAPQIIGEKLFLVSEFGGMYCIDAKSGRLLWNNPQIVSFVSASDKAVYATDKFNHVLMLALDTGLILGDLQLSQFTVHFPNSRTDRMFMCTPSGMIVALKEIGNDFPIYHQNPHDRPILPEIAPEKEAATEDVKTEAPAEPETNDAEPESEESDTSDADDADPETDETEETEDDANP